MKRGWPREDKSLCHAFFVAMTPATLKIDFVSDISCPWCAIALWALEQAAERVQDVVTLSWHFQPFELNPHMAPEGQDLQEHLREKYGSTPEQFQQIHATIAERGAALGFVFDSARRERIYNTFDAHRLLHWAQQEGNRGNRSNQGNRGEAACGLHRALKRALFAAYFSHGENPGEHDVLLRLVDEVGLDAQRARAVLQSTEFSDAVRAREAFYQRQGIQSVPAVIVNDRHLIQGGQPVAAFEQALRQIAASLSVT